MEPDELNNELEHLYRGAEAASSEGLRDEAIARCDKAMELLDIHFDQSLVYVHSDFMMLAGHSCWEDSEPAMAQRYYRQAFEMDFGRLDAAVAMSVSLYHLGAFASAQNHLEMVSVEEPDIGEVWYYLALLALRRKNKALANIFFQKASELEQNRWPRPKPMNEIEIKGFLTAFLNRLPDALRKSCASIPVLIQSCPPEELLHEFEPTLDPLIMVLFHGTPRVEEEAFEVSDPDNRLILFQDNIELNAHDPEKLSSLLDSVFLDEFSRYLGIELEELGY